MLTVRLRYIVEDVDRHGNVRVYFRPPQGPKLRMTDPVGSPEFMRRYAELRQDLAAGRHAQRAKRSAGPQANTFGWLCHQYTRSSHYRTLAPSTQRTRQLILDHCRAEPVFPGAASLYSDFPLDRLTQKALAVLRDRKATVPEAANTRVKTLRSMFKWAVAEDVLSSNPALGLAMLHNASDGHHTWTIDEIARYEARHPVGTMARLALDLMVYLGLRCSDVIVVGRQHVQEGWLSMPQFKGRTRSPTRIEVPVLPVLAATIAASPTGDLAFLQTAHGRPFSSAKSFGNWFGKRCAEAGLAGCTAHGLRKAGATRAAENGATAHQLMAIYNWRSIKEAETYTRQAERRRMARDGISALEIVPPDLKVGQNL